MPGRKIDHTNTKCRICGNDKTGRGVNGYPDWRRDKYRKEGWDGKSYICTRCESKERQRLPDSRNSVIKAIANSRNSLLDIDSNTAKGLIGEALIAKVRNLEVISIKLDNFRTRFDLSLDSEYDIIQSRLRSPYYGDWLVSIDREQYFDTLFALCMSNGMTDIKEIYAIPQKELRNTTATRICRNSKWKKFRISEKQYNDAYHSLMSYLKNRKYFGMEDIKKWLEDGKND